MATLQEIRNQVRTRIDETSTKFWTDTQLDSFINEGARDVARRGEVLQTRNEITTVNGTQEYSLPTDVVRVYRVEYQDASTQINALEYRDFNNMDAVWWSRQATADGKPYWYTMWGYPPSLKIIVYPTPNASGDKIRVFYYSMPANVTAWGDTVPCPQGWEDLIVLYAEYVALRKDADPRWQEAKVLYEERVAQMLDLTRRWTDQAGAITTGTSMGPSWLYDSGY